MNACVRDKDDMITLSKKVCFFRELSLKGEQNNRGDYAVLRRALNVLFRSLRAHHFRQTPR